MSSLKRPWESESPLSTSDNEYHGFSTTASFQYPDPQTSSQTSKCADDGNDVLDEDVEAMPISPKFIEYGEGLASREALFSSINNSQDEIESWVAKELDGAPTNSPGGTDIRVERDAEALQPHFDVCYGMVSSASFSNAHP